MSERHRIDCADVAELVPELALGLLDGAERAAVLEHVDSCAGCRAELATLTEVGERLLQLVPDAEPPPEFESRVLAEVASTGRRRPRRRLRSVAGSGTTASRRRTRFRLWATAAAAAAVLVGGFAGLLVAVNRDEAPAPRAAPQVTIANLHDREDEVVASAVYRPGSPPTVEVDMAEWLADIEERGVPLEGQWWLAVEDAAGETHLYALPMEPIVEVEMDHGPESPAARSAAILDEAGQVWCEGTFRDGNP